MKPQSHRDAEMNKSNSQTLWLFIVSLCLCASVAIVVSRTRAEQPKSTTPAETLEGCLKCHNQIEPMHRFGPTSTLDKLDHGKDALGLSCTACHGGNPVATEKDLAHVRPRFSTEWQRNGKFKIPERSGPLLARESLEFVRFLNPGDLRVAGKTCGSSECHSTETSAASNSMMRHGAMLWGAALYNNGGFPFKDTNFGESYGADGAPQRLIQIPQPTAEQRRLKGVLSFLDPIPRWEISQPGNVLRVFERGGKAKPEVGNPSLAEDPGKPEIKLSARGFGTELRTDPVFLGLQKTRLLDPLLSFPGTNDQPGDYRASGCSACHVIYANDRSPEHSGAYAKHGNLGQTATSDPTISRNESGHPIRHQFTRSIPSSQCIVCHIHPGTNMVSTYFGYTWWDNEMDGEHMWPAEQRRPNANEQNRTQTRNPEGSAVRGLWADTAFLEKTGTPEFNQQLQHTQFADFHSHGWIFRAVFKHDRKGNLQDADDKIVSFDDPEKLKRAVHLKDIHLEKGMHCVDCHFEQDSHGNGKLYGETRNAIEIDCVDCHGRIQQRASLVTSGTADPAGGTNLEGLRTPWQERRFYWKEDRLYQRSMLDNEKEWEVVQVRDTITLGNT